MIGLVAGLALAGAADCPPLDAGSDPLVTTLVEQLERNQDGLRLPNAPPLYHIRYHLTRMEQSSALASLGYLVEQSADPYVALSVETRVGAPEYDNTGFGGWENGFSSSWLPDALTPRSLALAAWRTTDGAYKSAVEQYARKKAQFTAPEDYPGDYTLTGAVSADCGEVALGDADEALERARAISAVFQDTGAVLERGEVHVGYEAGYHLLVDTEGTRVRRPKAEATLRAVLHVRAPDGMVLGDDQLWSARTTDDLPELEAMRERARELLAGLEELVKAPVFDEEYIGPVLFEDEAALTLFQRLLVPQLEGTPKELPFETFLGDLSLSGSTGVARIGRRVLPPGWVVSDDPAALPSHPASYRYDAEGTTAQAVELVADGIVRSVLMSRVPRKDITASNGHARGSLGERLNGRVSQVFIEAPRVQSAKKIRKKAMKLAEGYGRDYVLAVRKFQAPELRYLADLPGRSGEDESALPFPLAVVKVFADGREEVYRGGAFSGVQRFALRDIVAVGQPVEGTFMISGSPGDDLYSPTNGAPTWMQAHEVLIGELEVVPVPADPNDRPAIAPPDSTREEG